MAFICPATSADPAVEVLWTIEAGFVEAVAALGDRLFVVNDDGVLAFALATGNPLWRSDNPEPLEGSGGARLGTRGDALIVHAPNEYDLLLDIETGHVLEHHVTADERAAQPTPRWLATPEPASFDVNLDWTPSSGDGRAETQPGGSSWTRRSSTPAPTSSATCWSCSPPPATPSCCDRNQPHHRNDAGAALGSGPSPSN